MQAIQDAINRILVKERFLSAVLLRLPVNESQQTPIMATSGDAIFYNTEGVKEHLKTREEIIFVVLHELMHVILRHPFRFRRMPGLDPELANIAMDYEVNLLLTNLKGYREWFSMPKGALLDVKWKDMGWEEIYAALHKDAKPKPKQQGGGAGQQGQGQGNKGQQGQGEKGNVMAPGCGGEDVKPFQGDEGQAVKKEVEIAGAVAAAVAIAKACGSMPAGFEQLVNSLNEPKVPWTQELMHLASQVVRDDYCWRRPNPRYQQGGFMLPSLHSDKLGWIVIGRDTSGSMGPREINAITSEATGILETCKPSRMSVVDCDAVVENVVEIEEGNESTEWQGKAKGGGGTRFEPVFDWVAEQGEAPLTLIYMTDGYAPWPKTEPEYPVIWLITNKQTTPPWGKIIRIPTEEL